MRSPLTQYAPNTLIGLEDSRVISDPDPDYDPVGSNSSKSVRRGIGGHPLFGSFVSFLGGQDIGLAQ